VLAALAWYIVLPLRIRRKQKITIACGLSLGIFPTLFSILRIAAWTSPSFQPDYLHNASRILVWSSSDACLSIVCACIPTLRPLCLRFVHGRYESLVYRTRVLDGIFQYRSCVASAWPRHVTPVYSFVTYSEGPYQHVQIFPSEIA
jgi:hypothetical protein